MFTSVSNRSPKFLSDLERWEANLRVTCGRCRHSGDFDAGETARFFAAMGWSTAWGVIGRRFRCDHCGAKGAEVAMTPKALPRPVAEPPRPLTRREIKEAQRRERG